MSKKNQINYAKIINVGGQEFILNSNFGIKGDKNILNNIIQENPYYYDVLNNEIKLFEYECIDYNISLNNQSLRDFNSYKNNPNISKKELIESGYGAENSGYFIVNGKETNPKDLGKSMAKHINPKFGREKFDVFVRYYLNNKQASFKEFRKITTDIINSIWIDKNDIKYICTSLLTLGLDSNNENYIRNASGIMDIIKTKFLDYNVLKELNLFDDFFDNESKINILFKLEEVLKKGGIPRYLENEIEDFIITKCSELFHKEKPTEELKKLKDVFEQVKIKSDKKRIDIILSRKQNIDSNEIHEIKDFVSFKFINKNTTVLVLEDKSNDVYLRRYTINIKIDTNNRKIIEITGTNGEIKKSLLLTKKTSIKDFGEFYFLFKNKEFKNEFQSEIKKLGNKNYQFLTNDSIKKDLKLLKDTEKRLETYSTMENEIETAKKNIINTKTTTISLGKNERFRCYGKNEIKKITYSKNVDETNNYRFVLNNGSYFVYVNNELKKVTKLSKKLKERLESIFKDEEKIKENDLNNCTVEELKECISRVEENFEKQQEILIEQLIDRMFAIFVSLQNSENTNFTEKQKTSLVKIIELIKETEKNSKSLQNILEQYYGIYVSDDVYRNVLRMEENTFGDINKNLNIATQFYNMYSSLSIPRVNNNQQLPYDNTRLQNYDNAQSINNLIGNNDTYGSDVKIKNIRKSKRWKLLFNRQRIRGNLYYKDNNNKENEVSIRFKSKKTIGDFYSSHALNEHSILLNILSTNKGDLRKCKLKLNGKYIDNFNQIIELFQTNPELARKFTNCVNFKDFITKAAKKGLATDFFIDVNKETLIPFGIDETMYNELYSINLRYNVKTMKYSRLINKGLKWTIREKRYLRKHKDTLKIKEEYLDKINSKEFSKKKYSEAYKYKKIIENEKDKIKEKKLILEKLKSDNETIKEIIKGKQTNKTITNKEKKELEQQIKNNKQSIKDNKKFIEQSENAIMDIEIGMKNRDLLFFQRKSLSDNPTKKVNITLKKNKEKKIRFNKSIKSPDRSI